MIWKDAGAMQKKILLIRTGKSFMLNTLMKNLTSAGFEVVESEPTTEDIALHKGAAELILMFLGDYVDKETSALVYLKDICTEEDKLLVLVGTVPEIDTVTQSIPVALVAASFPRPFDMKKLTAQLDWLLEANDDLAKRKNILLVDDDGTFLKMVKDWLSVKYRVTIVTSGAQAMMYIADNTPDLILLDYESAGDDQERKQGGRHSRDLPHGQGGQGERAEGAGLKARRVSLKIHGAGKAHCRH